MRIIDWGSDVCASDLIMFIIESSVISSGVVAAQAVAARDEDRKAPEKRLRFARRRRKRRERFNGTHAMFRRGPDSSAMPQSRARRPGAPNAAARGSTETRRVGKAWVSTC